MCSCFFIYLLSKIKIKTTQQLDFFPFFPFSKHNLTERLKDRDLSVRKKIAFIIDDNLLKKIMQK